MLLAFVGTLARRGVDLLAPCERARLQGQRGRKQGAQAGSWNPSGFQWGSRGGRIYATSLSVCTLEVYYRHLPLFKQIEFDQAE